MGSSFLWKEEVKDEKIIDSIYEINGFERLLLQRKFEFLKVRVLGK